MVIRDSRCGKQRLSRFYFYVPQSELETDAVQQRRYYSVTPCLKIAMSWKPAASDFTFSPEATFRT